MLEVYHIPELPAKESESNEYENSECSNKTGAPDWSEEWLIAKDIAETRGIFLKPLGLGARHLLEHPFEESLGKRAFEYDPEIDSCWDRHQINRKITPSRFLSRVLSCSENYAYRIIKKAMRTGVPLKNVNRIVMGQEDRSTNSDSPSPPQRMARIHRKRNFDLQTCMENPLFRNRCFLLTDFFMALFDNPINPSQLETAWARGRGWASSWIQTNFRSHVFLGSNPQLLMESIALKLKWSNEQRLKSCLWTRGKGDSLYPFWWGPDYRILFPLWVPWQDGYLTQWLVTGFRLRRVTSSGANTPSKEMQSSLRNIPELRGYPTQIGFFGLFREPSPSIARMDGCRGLTVVLTEGISDMYAGRRLLAIDDIEHTAKSQVIFATAGSISENTRDLNLPFLRNAKRLIVAYNDDSTYGGTTGQRKMIDAVATIRKAGISANALPTIALEGCNDLNDLLHKRLSENEGKYSEFARAIIETVKE